MKWISVEDQKPSITEEYIVFAVNGTATIVTCIEFYDGVFQTEEDGAIWNEMVTHWMPLPEPPNELNKG